MPDITQGTTDMDVLDAIKNRKSIRAFLDKPMEHRLLYMFTLTVHWFLITLRWRSEQLPRSYAWPLLNAILEPVSWQRRFIILT